MLLIHTFITWALVGLIWHVQIVQYPLFLEVGREAFERYHVGHCLRISFVVGPLILLESATAAWLLWQGETQPLFLASLGFIVLAWASTFFMQVPVHNRLTLEGWSEPLIRRLIRTNWLRTLAWTARGLMLAWLLLR
ncbi:hypothetical protein SAMN02745166_04633 [Prosthecobacter debontii]|uniref:DUF1772 domain-containing protein n=1 Tax=Prosthecobacter debontii TaxID=48467 RepID=A0A1T4Z0R6_9BACT|nr:hypothetical protein [Prosthecobacter debontii]SKB07161.1 hypothetical protein SAMN02745166_04633 [Prosthecobacter debontii]